MLLGASKSSKKETQHFAEKALYKLIIDHPHPDRKWLNEAATTEECQQARILARHPGKEQEAFQKLLKSLFAAYEPAGEDEPNAYNVSIDQNMTKDDVMNAVIKTIENDK